jgi:mannose-1-phosphate guanylyltransferase
MKIVVFAGGVGSRLWPVSRKNSPKQFEKLIGDQSTLQQSVERLLPEFSPSDIYIATGKKYYDTIKEQLPVIPDENFLLEPEMRDVGPAIGLVAALLTKMFPDEPVAILWSDHLVQNGLEFRKVLRLAEEKVNSNTANFVYIAQKPRFANQNCGWIELGEKVSSDNSYEVYQFKKLRYRPTLEEAQKFFADDHYVWNLGYFVTTPKYLLELFDTYAPQMHDKLQVLKDNWQTPEYAKVLSEIYPTFEKISFDDAILVKMSTQGIYVISTDIGWSDIGTWDALKEALSKIADENVTKGNVLLENSRDSLVFNYSDQLSVGIDLNEMIVINTHDVLLVCPKNSVPKIKKLVENLSGTTHEHLI